MIFIGNSFMICVLNAASDAGMTFRAITIKKANNEGHLFGLDRSRLIEDAGKPDFAPETKALIAESEGPVYSFLGGVNHVQMALRATQVADEPTFDFILPDATHLPLDPHAQLLPYAAVREAVRNSFSRRLKLLGRVTLLAPGRVYQFAPPPPVSDDWMQRWLEGLPPEIAESGALPNRHLRYKLWCLTCDIFREQAESQGATFVGPPPDSMDEEGFMRDELVRNITHGNKEFGALVLEQLTALP